MLSPLITSRANPRVKQLRAAFAGNARLADGLVAIEGENLIGEAIRSNIALRTIFVREHASLPDEVSGDVEVIYLTDDVFASAVDTQSPQGIAALIEPTRWEIEAVLNPSRGLQAQISALLLIAAGVQDPGNLGTLIRSAEAFAATAVLTTPGTVSPWNQKAMRASAGSVFRAPVVSIEIADLTALKSRGIRLLAAVAPMSAADADPIPDLTQPSALMIGNEGAGLSPELLALADARVSIPTPGPVESLNAAIAGSLLLYESARQREAARQRQIPRTSHLAPRT